MKRSSFIALFIGTHITFVLLHIHKQSQLIKLSYEKQKIEQIKTALNEIKRQLTHQLCTLHNFASVKEYVANHPAMKLKPVKISQIKKLSHDTNI